MNKLLLGTTALMGAVVFAGAASAQQVTTTSPFTVTIGGDFRSEFGWIDDDGRTSATVDGTNSVESRFDYRFIIQASAKADNGLEYGVWFRIRNGGGGQPNGDGLRSDYKYIWAQGGWGRVELGDADDVAGETSVFAPTVGIGQIDGTATNWVNIGYLSNSPNGNPYMYGNQTASTKVNYFTPRFSGFMAGIGYTPEETDRGNSIRRLDSAGTYQNQVDLGVNYTATFSGVGVKVGAGYKWAEAKQTNFDDLGVWNVGAQVSYAGFTFGGGYFDNDNAGFTAASGTESSGWNVGLTYAVGPWALGASYANISTDNSVIGGVRDDRSDEIFSVGGVYTLAPGLTLNLDYYHFDAETAAAGFGGVVYPTGGNEGNLVVLRTRVRF